MHMRQLNTSVGSRQPHVPQAVVHGAWSRRSIRTPRLVQRSALDAEVSLEATADTHFASRRALLFLAAATATTQQFAATAGATTQPDIQQLEVWRYPAAADHSRLVGVAALAALNSTPQGSPVTAWLARTTAWLLLPTTHNAQVEAYEAYANREFSTVLQKLEAILSAEPDNPRWYEMRAQTYVDAKQFDAAVQDFDKALTLIPADQQPVTAARLRSGRALAYEGLSLWQAAQDDYMAALDLAAAAGESPDAYIINAIGNTQNSLQRWSEARESYLTSSQLFQQAKGFRGRGGSTTQRLDGAIYAASNAALMLAQLGEEEGALKEFEKVARRAPGSSDTRAALAALYWRAGKYERAEASWQFACENITAGCSKYQDREWLQTVRRWPPVMVGYLQDFLRLKQDAGSSGGLKTWAAST